MISYAGLLGQTSLAGESAMVPYGHKEGEAWVYEPARLTLSTGFHDGLAVMALVGAIGFNMEITDSRGNVWTPKPPETSQFVEQMSGVIGHPAQDLALYFGHITTPLVAGDTIAIHLPSAGEGPEVWAACLGFAGTRAPLGEPPYEGPKIGTWGQSVSPTRNPLPETPNTAAIWPWEPGLIEPPPETERLTISLACWQHGLARAGDHSRKLTAWKGPLTTAVELHAPNPAGYGAGPPHNYYGVDAAVGYHIGTPISPFNPGAKWEGPAASAEEETNAFEGIIAGYVGNPEPPEPGEPVVVAGPARIGRVGPG